MGNVLFWLISLFLCDFSQLTLVVTDVSGHPWLPYISPLNMSQIFCPETSETTDLRCINSVRGKQEHSRQRKKYGRSTKREQEDFREKLPVQSMRDLWSTEWNWDKLLPSTSVLIVSPLLPSHLFIYYRHCVMITIESVLKQCTWKDYSISFKNCQVIELLDVIICISHVSNKFLISVTAVIMLRFTTVTVLVLATPHHCILLLGPSRCSTCDLIVLG